MQARQPSVDWQAEPSESKPCIFDEGPLPGPENMRRDAELFRRAQHERRLFARIYEWRGVWVSLGRSQSPGVVLKQPHVVPWVMRPTGGGAVLHGHDLTVAVGLPLNGDFRNLKTVHRRIARFLIIALRSVGIQAVLGEDCGHTTRATAADCFLCVSPNDIVDSITGRKLIGVAMRVARGAALAQCSIPVRIPLVQPSSIFVSGHAPTSLDVRMLELRRAVIDALHTCRWEHIS